MAKIQIEVCMISSRGLRQKISIFKKQWFAVGWIDPNTKYCTKIDASGNQNPSWKTKFSILVDKSDPKFVDIALHIEVYSREPIFLKKKLRGTATILLKEFLNKYAGDQGGSELKTEEVGSFQLRKGKSNKPEGLIDISIRVTGETEGQNPTLANGEGFRLKSHGGGVILASTGGSAQAYAGYPQPLAPYSGPVSHSDLTLPYSLPATYAKFSSPATAASPSYPLAAAGGPSSGYQRSQTPPPPPPPSNVCYVPTFIPGTNYLSPHQSYVNMPFSSAQGNWCHDLRR